MLARHLAACPPAPFIGTITATEGAGAGKGKRSRPKWRTCHANTITPAKPIVAKTSQSASSAVTMVASMQAARLAAAPHRGIQEPPRGEVGCFTPKPRRARRADFSRPPRPPGAWIRPEKQADL